ncbi:retropepsin-like aspartic protease family protein [Sphingopyxis sp. 113P3]|uniref:retropepsin-like aspartic protease family protein n=1 Tax=Sphingopyxis sp. (strain 113P3) TaxID=292913 RepID=UPI0006AD1ADC|nr:TIGR02281 family clan AA aspartic protease [Sphingopyxis sp. 113P3]ALC12089.1 aspartyl protease [Sphingopyxis sp. 113P3]
MLGRFIGIAAGIAAVSVGVAGIASRSAPDRVPSTMDAGDENSNWTTQRRERGGWTAASPRGSSEVQLSRAGDSHFYADAEINGRPVRMMVDSGASIVALTRADAEAVGIDVDRLPVSGTARTAGGDVPMRTLLLTSVEVGGIEIRGVPAAVVDADMGVSLLGQSYLAKLGAVTIEGDTMTLR